VETKVLEGFVLKSPLFQDLGSHERHATGTIEFWNAVAMRDRTSLGEHAHPNGVET
jgi:hypothetical protein